MNVCFVCDLSYSLDSVYIVENIDSEFDLSVDEEGEEELIDTASELEASSETDTTDTVGYSELYDVAVSQAYLLGVIAFGVFLVCGLLIGKIFWERFR